MNFLLFLYLFIFVFFNFFIFRNFPNNFPASVLFLLHFFLHFFITFLPCFLLIIPNLSFLFLHYPSFYLITLLGSSPDFFFRTTHSFIIYSFICDFFILFFFLLFYERDFVFKMLFRSSSTLTLLPLCTHAHFSSRGNHTSYKHRELQIHSHIYTIKLAMHTHMCICVRDCVHANVCKLASGI